MPSAEKVCEGCGKRPCVCETVVLSSAEKDAQEPTGTMLQSEPLPPCTRPACACPATSCLPLDAAVERSKGHVLPPGADHEHVWTEAEVTSGPTMVGERLTVCAVCGTTRVLPPGGQP